MQDKIMQVASRIREIREIFRVSLADLAREFQVPEADYRQYRAAPWTSRWGSCSRSPSASTWS